MIDNIQHKVKGHIEILLTDKNGNTVDKVEDHNIVVNYAKTSIIKCISGGEQNLFGVLGIQIGVDVGTGDKFIPEQPIATTGSADMDLLYQSSGVEVAYPTEESVLFAITIDGNVLVDAAQAKFATSQETVDINSSALITGNGNPFSYKRYPVKVVTRFINVTIRWILDF